MASIFLSDKHSPLANCYVDNCFCAKLANLSDMFNQLNCLNLSMQGRNSSLFLVADKIKGSKKVLVLWKKNISNERFGVFPLLSENFEAFTYEDISSIVAVWGVSTP